MGSQIQEVARHLEEEISHYENLVAALKKEADHLRQGSPENLLQSVKDVSAQVAAIQQIHQEARKKIEGVLRAAGNEALKRTLADLIQQLPPKESQRLQTYQRTLDNLKTWVMQINFRNKAFIQESLAHWKDLFSLLNPANALSPGYVPNGKKNPSRQLPVSLDRKV